MNRKVFSFNSQLDKVTGVQKVVMDVHHAVRDNFEARIIGTVPYGRVQPDLGIAKEEYMRLRNPFVLRHATVIVHERKYLLLFWLLNALFFLDLKMVYVHHSLLFGHRLTTVLPKTVVAISDSGVENLHHYFRVPLENIHKIHNCVKDIGPAPHNRYEGGMVRLLLAARVNNVKRQLEIVEHLKGKLSENVMITFAGTGPNYDKLRDMVKHLPNFECLGYRSDIYDLLAQSHYLLLFSEHEGLPITLIEAMMTGLPAVCSNVGGCAEIVENGENGFVLDKDNWQGLADTLNQLPGITSSQYEAMSRKSRLKYEQCFTFEQFRQAYIKLIDNL